MHPVALAVCCVLAWGALASANPGAHFPRLMIRWQPSDLSTSLPLEGYRLFRACDPQGLEWTWLTDVPLGQNHYQDTALRYGQRCCYKVYARYRDVAPPPKKGRKKASPTEPPAASYRLSPAMPEHCADTPPEPPLPGVEQVEVGP